MVVGLVALKRVAVKSVAYKATFVWRGTPSVLFLLCSCAKCIFSRDSSVYLKESLRFDLFIVFFNVCVGLAPKDNVNGSVAPRNIVD